MIEARLTERIQQCHSADGCQFVPWFAAGAAIGHVHRERQDVLAAAPSPFRRDAAGAWHLPGNSPAARSAALAAWLPTLAAAGQIRSLTGELYAAGTATGDTHCLVDRAAVAWLGVRAAGVHLNGYVAGDDGLRLWVARRARGKATFPGHLDNLVAGGQSHDLDAATTLAKECHEEAGMAAALARTARAVTTLAYTQQDGRSLKADTLTIFDLELPAAWQPRALDGEVEAFALLPVAEVLASLAGDGLWKPNCALVAIDFLLRHGALDGELAPAARWRLWQQLHAG
jgi:isopentenyldiphosphate isomerase